ncbi:MAG: DUF3540 domain-containing protein [Minicystis sp.]
MDGVARKIEVKAVFQEFGEVVAINAGLLTVRTALADLTARRAASCLLEPSLGDRVLVATEERGDAYVLAVLEQHNPETARLSVEGNLTLRSLRGKVTVAAQEGVDIVSAAAVKLMGSAVEVEAVEALSVLSGVVKAELGKVKMYASTLDSFFERVSLHAKQSFRTVDELDQVKARQIDYAASGNAHLRGENALISADDLVKLNGEQVHIG